MKLGHLLAVARRQARDADILEASVSPGDAGRLQLELESRKEAHNLLLLVTNLSLPWAPRKELKEFCDLALKLQIVCVFF